MSLGRDGRSHFADYMLERENAEIIETEKGFVCFKFEDENCIITDIYIAPEFRNGQVGRDFGKQVEEKAKEKGLDCVYCYADKNALNFNDSVNFILKNKYIIQNIDGNLVYFKKGIKHG